MPAYLLEREHGNQKSRNSWKMSLRQCAFWYWLSGKCFDIQFRKKCGSDRYGKCSDGCSENCTSKRAEHVTLYARGNEITASSHEVSYATLDGAEFVFGMQIEVPSMRKDRYSKKQWWLKKENIIGEEEELIQVEADSTIISISQGPRKKLIRTTFGLEGSDKGLLIVDDNYMTTKPGVFAGRCHYRFENGRTCCWWS